MQYVLILVTASNKKEAQKIGNTLLDKRLVACCNIISNIQSDYWWQGRKERAKESLLIAKTKRTAVKKVIKTVKAAHSYDVPEIIALPIIEGSSSYLNWIRETVG